MTCSGFVRGLWVVRSTMGNEQLPLAGEALGNEERGLSARAPHRTMFTQRFLGFPGWFGDKGVQRGHVGLLTLDLVAKGKHHIGV